MGSFSEREGRIQNAHDLRPAGLGRYTCEKPNNKGRYVVAVPWYVSEQNMRLAPSTGAFRSHRRGLGLGVEASFRRQRAANATESMRNVHSI